MVATPSTSSQTKGVVRQVIGPVLDVEFPAGKLPKILNALRIEAKNPAGQDIALTAEVQQLLGDHRVRAVAMSGTDGLVRGMEAIDTGAPISVPVGEATLGRPDACPYNSLYWRFIDRHLDTFGSNPRMGLIAANWRKRDPEERAVIVQWADTMIEVWA